MAKKEKAKELSLQQIGLNFYEDRTEKSFAALMNRLKPGLGKYVREKYGCDDYQTREAVLLNTFTNIWSKIEQYDPYYAFSTWAYRIARNEALLSKRYGKKNYSLDGMQEMGINMTAKYPSLVSEPDYEFFEPTAEEEMDRLYKLVLDEIGNLPGVYSVVLTGQLIKKQKLDDIKIKYKDYKKIVLLPYNAHSKFFKTFFNDKETTILDDNILLKKYLNIKPISQLNEVGFDIILITSITFEKKIRDKLISLGIDNKKIFLQV